MKYFHKNLHNLQLYSLIDINMQSQVITKHNIAKHRIPITLGHISNKCVIYSCSTFCEITEKCGALLPNEVVTWFLESIIFVSITKVKQLIFNAQGTLLSFLGGLLVELLKWIIFIFSRSQEFICLSPLSRGGSRKPPRGGS